MMLRDNNTKSSNKKYKGYCIDLLEKIAKICNFTYTIKLVEDGFHGSFVNGKWNGIIGELIEQVNFLFLFGRFCFFVSHSSLKLFSFHFESL